MFLTLLSIAITALASTNARFAVILRDRASSEFTEGSDGILDAQFRSLQSKVRDDMVVTIVSSLSFTMIGAMIAIHPTWLPARHKPIFANFGLLLLIFAVIMIATGAYLADHVHGFQSTFEKFGGDDIIPYYSIMYHGGIAQAMYGAVLILAASFVAVICVGLDRYEWKHRAAIARTMAVRDDEENRTTA